MEATIQGLGLGCRPMINKPPPFKGLNIRILMIILAKGRGFINQGSALANISNCWIVRFACSRVVWGYLLGS